MVLGRREVLVRELGGARDEGGQGEGDSERFLHALLGCDHGCEADGEGHFGLLGLLDCRRCGGGRGLLGLWWRSGSRELDVGEVEVGELGEAGGRLGRVVLGDLADVCEHVALEQTAVGTRGRDLVGVLLGQTVCLEQVLHGWVQRVLLLLCLAALCLLRRISLGLAGLWLLLLFLLGLRGLCLCCGCAGVVLRGDLQGVDVVALLGGHGNPLADLDALGLASLHDLDHDTVVLRLNIHGRLIGLDLQKHVSGGEGLALLDPPVGDVALGHGRREGGHGEVLGGAVCGRGHES